MSEQNVSREIPLGSALKSLTLAEDGTLLDDRAIVPLTVGDIRHIIRKYESAMCKIGELAMENSAEK